MRLLKVHLDGYKRFREHTSLHVGRPRLALIGRNESGKSSVLSALVGLGRPNWNTDDLNMHRDSPAHHPVIKVEFSLEERDIAPLRPLGFATFPTRLHCWKTFGGALEWQLSPEPTYEAWDEASAVRDALEAINELLSPSGSSGLAIIATRLANQDLLQLQEALNRRVPISADHLQTLQALATGTHPHFSSKSPQDQGRLQTTLHQLYSAWALRATPAKDRFGGMLGRHWPVFALFDPASDLLEPRVSLHDLSDEAAAARAPLLLLIRFGGQSGKAVLDFVRAGKRREAQTILTRAERRINERVADSWPNRNLNIKLHLEDGTLELQVADRQTDEILPFTARSQGLKIFLSLMAFSQRHDREKHLVVLIDEIETHLHVDAQRQLIQALERLPSDHQFIYTTHSPFALPSDVSAVREIHANDVNGTSTVENHVWQNTTKGLLGLHLRMGASEAAHWLSRHLLVVEGITDAVLIPRMMAAALGALPRGITCVPGFPYAGKTPLIFESQGLSVAYWFDGDRAGQGYVKALTAQQVPPDRLHTWPDATMVEDYLSEDLYRRAVHEAERAYDVTAVALPAGSLPGPNRPAQLTALLEGMGRRAPDKMAVTAKVLELWQECPEPLDPARKDALKELANTVLAALKLTGAGGDPPR